MPADEGAGGGEQAGVSSHARCSGSEAAGAARRRRLAPPGWAGRTAFRGAVPLHPHCEDAAGRDRARQRARLPRTVPPRKPRAFLSAKDSVMVSFGL